MRFVAIDVETANADMASLCSLGVAEFENGELVSEWYSLIDPEDFFEPLNMSIHGISEWDVQGAPTFRSLAPEIGSLLAGKVVVTHTHFDRVAMHQAAARWSISPFECTWLDSARVARRTWSECSSSGYGLADVCKIIGYSFEHHNALEDAKASGHVILAAMRESGLDCNAIRELVSKPIGRSSAPADRIAPAGTADEEFCGEVVVFTGALDMPRREAADLACSVGYTVEKNVTRQTTLLVVGDTDVTRLAGHEKSSKHRKAESLASKGQPLRILRESDFMKLVEPAAQVSAQES